MHDLKSAKSASVGLVLSGGGAKGAYQVGVLKALNELGVQVDMLSGASIGSLNGAIIAAAENQEEAAANLEKLWLELASLSPIAAGPKLIKLPSYLAMLAGFGLTSPLLGALSAAVARSNTALKSMGVAQTLDDLLGVRPAAGNSEEGLFCDKRIQRLIDQYLGDKGLPLRLPLHVSVYPTQGAGLDILRIVGAMISVSDTKDSEFIHIQSLARADQKRVLLASAALPLLYAPQEVNGQLYTDGGQGGWTSVQGNTPITPLLRAGCRHVVVTHLSDGSIWDRSQFPEANIIEIRPKTRSMVRVSATRDLLGFDSEKIPSWIAQGYEDTHACIAPVLKTINTFGALNASERMRDEALGRTGQEALRDAMRRLDGCG